VGLFLLVTLGVLLGAAVLTSGVLEGQYEVHLATAQAEGLTQDTRVVLQGLAIGRVKEVTPHLDTATNQLRFVATLTIRERFPDGTRLVLPKGIQAEIAPPPTLVGPTVIQLLMPPPGEADGTLEPDDTIPATRRPNVMSELTEIATKVRGNLEGALAETRALLAQTARTVEAAGDLLAQSEPRVVALLARLDTSLTRTDRIVAAVEPRVGPTADTLMATLVATHEMLAELDSLTTLARSMALENRDEITQTVERLSRSAVILENFAERVSRRPLRLLTGITPPPDTGRRQP
jgi:ABC-type transporter Mla subunit MlaD